MKMENCVGCVQCSMFNDLAFGFWSVHCIMSCSNEICAENREKKNIIVVFFRVNFDDFQKFKYSVHSSMLSTLFVGLSHFVFCVSHGKMHKRNLCSKKRDFTFLFGVFRCHPNHYRFIYHKMSTQKPNW